MTENAGTSGDADKRLRFSADIAGNYRAVHRFWASRRGRRIRPAGGRALACYVAGVACLVLMALLFADRPVGAYRGQWPDGLRTLARTITDIGESFWYLVPSGLFILGALMIDWRALAGRARWRMANGFALAAYVFLTVAASGLLATTLKRVIGRARPKHFDDQGILSFDSFATDASFASFPSGHATTCGALAGIVALVFPALRVPAILIGMALASTRVFVGAHYPSDVIAGFAFGLWFAWLVALAFAGRGIMFVAASGPLPAPHPSFGRFLSAVRRRFVSGVPFLQRRSDKLS